MIKGVRGAPDILPDEIGKWQRVEEVARSIFHTYGYTEIRTPIFEKTELFIRGIGQGTDIVEKEMYTFLDQSRESLTLRPEETAPVIRAYLEHNLSARASLVKVYYIGPMFRHERPQAGRFRQFHQIGAEAIGSDHPAVDAELLALLQQFFHELEIQEVELHLNSIGDPGCRPRFREHFVASMLAREPELCEDCRMRLRRNPLRILDCKNEGCRRVVEGAPKPIQFLCEPCTEHFKRLEELLHLLDVKYVINDRLVRGLDYYTRTTFEFVNKTLGAQNALVGGGRYDGLVEALGGPPTPGIGFAMGIERVVASLPKDLQAAAALQGVYVATLGREAWEKGFWIVQALRQKGVRATLDVEGRSLKGQLRQANKEKFRYCLILGEDELKKGQVTLKDMKEGGQKSIMLDEAVERLVERQGP
ncbi:MAG: histidine--tRNA ligase [candidate division NC10 bacterium]|nr:histidine--tRNA ligase [candidate division NC10 bacterium]